MGGGLGATSLYTKQNNSMKKNIYYLIIITIINISCSSSSIIKENKEKIADINRENYYEYLQSPSQNEFVKTSWLDKDEILEILFNQLRQHGFKVIKYIQAEINNKIVLLHGYDTYKNIGFIVEDSHSSPNKKHRGKIHSLSYSMINEEGISSLEYIDNVPINIFIFKEEWYWYQEVEPNSSKILVAKEDIINIVKEDLDYYLSKYSSL